MQANYQLSIMHAGKLVKTLIKLLRCQNHYSYNRKNQSEMYYGIAEVVTYSDSGLSFQDLLRYIAARRG